MEKTAPESSSIFNLKLDRSFYRRKTWQTLFYLVGAGYCSALGALTLAIAWDKDIVLLDNIRAYSVSLNSTLTVFGYLCRVS